MFTDHLFFSWVTGMVWILAMLTFIATTHRVRFLTLHLRPAPVSPLAAIGQTPIKSSAISFTHFQNCAECINRSLQPESPHRKREASILNLPRDLFPLGRRAPANGKEDTSC